MKMQNRNLWGVAQTGVDPQRADLFRVILNVPEAIAGMSGVGGWNEHVEFAIEKFPFPERNREMIPVKYLNQTNFVLGPDSPVGQIDLTIRYAFNARTLELLEKWNFLTSNPITGGVGLTTRLKADGELWFLVPDHAAQEADVSTAVGQSGNAGLIPGARYYLEGCLIKGLRLSELDQSSTNGLVTATFSLQIDRYYPVDVNAMQVPTQ